MTNITQSFNDSYYDSLPPTDMLDKIFTMCLENSAFFQDNNQILDDLAEMTDVYRSLQINKPSKDFVWPMINNEVSNIVDGYMINAELINTKVEDELYSYSAVRKVSEVVTDYEIDDSIEKVPPLSHSVGIAMTYLSESLSAVYDNFLEMDYDIADVNSEKVADALGDYTSIDWFQKPIVSKSLDNDRSRYVREVWNFLLSNVSPGSRILSIGGDCGSASKRNRDYSIDCVYFDEKTYQNALKDRVRYQSHGKDYLYGVDFKFEDHDPSTWTVCTFNYYAERFLLTRIYEFFKDSMCQVWGILCSPKWDDSECVYSNQPYDSNNINNLPFDYVKANYHNYQILGRIGNKVALYTTHGRFEDVIVDYEEEWLYEIPLQTLHQLLPKGTFKSSYLHSLCHTSLFIIQTRNESKIFSTALFPIPSYSLLQTNVFLYTIKKDEMYDDRNLFVMKIPQMVDKNKYDGFKVKVYRGVIHYPDGTVSDADYTVALDINISGSYFRRRCVLESLGFKMYTYGNISSSYKRKWHDPFDSHYCSLSELVNLLDDGTPVYSKVRELMHLSAGDYKRLKTQNDEHFVPIVENVLDNYSFIKQQFAKFPIILVKNISYNPILKKLVYSVDNHAFLMYRNNSLLGRDTFNTDKMIDVLLVKDHESCCTFNDEGIGDYNDNPDLDCSCPMRFVDDLFNENGIPFTMVFLNYSFSVTDSPLNLRTVDTSALDVVCDWVDDEVHDGGDW